MSKKSLTEKKCKHCEKSFFELPCLAKRKTFCSYSCSAKARIYTKKTREKMRIAKLGKSSWNKGMIGFRSGESHPFYGKKRLDIVGENNPNWIKDRTLLKKKELRNDSAYQVWRKEVYTRDNFKCRIDNNDCNGRLEAHHILSWKDHPELRYSVNNGITLCKDHHPRSKEEIKSTTYYLHYLINENI